MPFKVKTCPEEREVASRNGDRGDIQREGGGDGAGPCAQGSVMVGGASGLGGCMVV